MNHGLNLAHTTLCAKFSEHLQRSLEVFHTALFVGGNTTETSEQFADLHAKVVGLSKDEGLAIMLHGFLRSTGIVQYLPEQHGDFHQRLHIPCVGHGGQGFGIMEQCQL